MILQWILSYTCWKTTRVSKTSCFAVRIALAKDVPEKYVMQYIVVYKLLTLFRDQLVELLVRVLDHQIRRETVGERKSREEEEERVRRDEEERKRREEEERRRGESEERKRLEAELERERQRLREKEAELATAQAQAPAPEQASSELRLRLNELGACENNYAWIKVEGGYQCSSGGHFVSDARLQVCS